ncbi:MAG: rod shape-determining protein MreD [Deltaproteobacteria bacterium]|nr:rod shape-determining protein MreD [Deltaproteobacteria bacterium]
MSWAVSILYILVKGNLIDYGIPRFLDVDLVLVIIVYLLVYYGEAGAGIFAFGQGLLIDIFSGGMLGLFTLLYLIIFLVIRLGSRPLDLLSIGGQIVVVSLAVLLKDALVVSLLHLFSLEIRLSFSEFMMFVSSSLCSGLITPFLFSLFNRLNYMLTGVYRESWKGVDGSL